MAVGLQRRHSQEYLPKIEKIREGALGDEPLNDGWHGATSSMTAVMGRTATYSGQTVQWDDAVAKGPREVPEQLALDATPPIVPNPEGSYDVPVPGIYHPF